MRGSYRDVERPDKPWKYPYVAGVVDFGSNLSISVVKADSRAVGYAINPTLSISNTNKAVLGFIDKFCENHGIEPTLQGGDRTNRLVISKRKDLHKFLLVVEPYLIARSEAVELMLKQLLPAFDNGKHSDKRGFLKMMEYVEQVREHTSKRGNPKYTTQFFRNEWNM